MTLSARQGRDRKRRSPRVAYLRSVYGDAAEMTFRVKDPLKGYLRLRRLGTVDAVFDFLLAFDPTQKALYLQAILRWFVDGRILIEDGRKVRDVLARFDACKRFLDISERDINSYVSPGQISMVLSTLDGGGLRVPLRMPDEVAAGSPVVRSGPDWSIRRLDTFVASEWWADSTDWCTRHVRHFEAYREMGPLYVLERGGRKFQVSDSGDQVMDERDEDGIAGLGVVFPADARSALAALLIEDRLRGACPGYTSGLGLPKVVEGKVAGRTAWIMPVLSHNVIARLYGWSMGGDANYVVCSARGLEATVCFDVPGQGMLTVTTYPDAHAGGRSVTTVVASGASLVACKKQVRQIAALAFRGPAALRDFSSDVVGVRVPALGRRGTPVRIHETREYKSRIVEMLKMPSAASARHWFIKAGPNPVALLAVRDAGNVQPNPSKVRLGLRLFGQGVEAGTVRDFEWQAGGGRALDAMDDLQAGVVRAMFRHVYPGAATIIDIGPEILSPAAARHWFGGLDEHCAERSAMLVMELRNREGVPGGAPAASLVDRCIDLVAPSSDHALQVLASAHCLGLSGASELRKRLIARCVPSARRLLDTYASLNARANVKRPAEDPTPRDMLEIAGVPGTDHLVSVISPGKIKRAFVERLIAAGRHEVISWVPREVADEIRRDRAGIAPGEEVCQAHLSRYDISKGQGRSSHVDASSRMVRAGIPRYIAFE